MELIPLVKLMLLIVSAAVLLFIIISYVLYKVKGSRLEPSKRQPWLTSLRKSTIMRTKVKAESKASGNNRNETRLVKKPRVNVVNSVKTEKQTGKEKQVKPQVSKERFYVVNKNADRNIKENDEKNNGVLEKYSEEKEKIKRIKFK